MDVDDMLAELYILAVAPKDYAIKEMKDVMAYNGFALIDIRPALKIERGICAEIAEAIDSKRGNEQVIADAIRARGKHD